VLLQAGDICSRVQHLALVSEGVVRRQFDWLVAMVNKPEPALVAWMQDKVLDTHCKGMIFGGK